MTEKTRKASPPEVIDEELRGIESIPTPGGLSEQIISSGSALQQIRGERITAISVQKKRSISQIAHAVYEETERAGAAFLYKWRQGGGWIKGGTIDLALCIARNFGNSEVRISVDEYTDHWMFFGMWTDYETGFNIIRPYRQRKDQNIGGGYDDDPGRKLDILFQIGASKCLRNVIFNSVPGYIKDTAIEKAEVAATREIKPEDIPAKSKLAVEAFASYADPEQEFEITRRLIERERGAPTNKWTAADLVELRSSLNSIKERTYSFEEIFGTPDDLLEPSEDSGAGASESDAEAPKTSGEGDNPEQASESPSADLVAGAHSVVEALVHQQAKDEKARDSLRTAILECSFGITDPAELISVPDDILEKGTALAAKVDTTLGQVGPGKTLDKWTKADWKSAIERTKDELASELPF
jgi:hypothetical protein